MKKLYLLVLALVLTGCCTKPLTSNTQIVEVPIAVKCTPTLNVTEIQVHPLAKIRKDMSLYEKNQLTVAELKLVEGQNKELKAALSECTK